MYVRGTHLARNHEDKCLVLALGEGISFYFEGQADSEENDKNGFAVFVGPCERQTAFFKYDVHMFEGPRGSKTVSFGYI